MSSESVQALLNQMRVMGDMAAGKPSAVASASAVNDQGIDFKAILKQAIAEVSSAQNTAQAKVQAFSMGDNAMSLEEVMVSLQKANLSFQTMIAVRNRLIEAYKEVSNMQV
jgi:flagellar hook-basal body complex protein FliE